MKFRVLRASDNSVSSVEIADLSALLDFVREAGNACILDLQDSRGPSIEIYDAYRE